MRMNTGLMEHEKKKELLYTSREVLSSDQIKSIYFNCDPWHIAKLSSIKKLTSVVLQVVILVCRYKIRVGI